MDRLEEIREQLEWGNKNLERAVDNLCLVDVFWLIEQAEQYTIPVNDLEETLRKLTDENQLKERDEIIKKQAEEIEKLEEELQLYKSHYPRPKTAF